MSSRCLVTIVGSGPSGLAAAMLAAKRVGGENVTLLEESPSIGGLWKSFDYGSSGIFDHGMHNYSECGIPEIDNFFFGLLDPDDRTILSGAARDLAGVFFGGKLQANSPSIDLRGIPPELLAQCIQEVLTAAKIERDSPFENAIEFALAQWGPTVTTRFIAPILERQFGVSSDQLSIGALNLTALKRVILLDAENLLPLMTDEAVRSRIAFPEQRALPVNFSSGRKALYPRRRGLHQIVEATSRELSRMGVRFATGHRVTSFSLRNGNINAVSVSAGGRSTLLPCTEVIWSAGLRPLSPLLGVPWISDRFVPPRATTVVNLLSPYPLLDKGLHYFYCYDPGLATFRVSCYRNYCHDALTVDGYAPYSVEMIDISPENARNQVKEELVKFGLIDATEIDKLRIVGCESLGRSFPMPTLSNERALDDVRDGISAQKVDNLRIIGSQSMRGLFFQPDVLRHLYSSVNELLG